MGRISNSTAIVSRASHCHAASAAGQTAAENMNRIHDSGYMSVILRLCKLAFIGLRKIGRGMARSLLRAGHTLDV